MSCHSELSAPLPSDPIGDVVFGQLLFAFLWCFLYPIGIDCAEALFLCSCRCFSKLHACFFALCLDFDSLLSLCESEELEIVVLLSPLLVCESLSGVELSAILSDVVDPNEWEDVDVVEDVSSTSWNTPLLESPCVAFDCGYLARGRWLALLFLLVGHFLYVFNNSLLS